MLGRDLSTLSHIIPSTFQDNLRSRWYQLHYSWVAQLLQLVIINASEICCALAIYCHFIKLNHIKLPSEKIKNNGRSVLSTYLICDWTKVRPCDSKFPAVSLPPKEVSFCTTAKTDVRMPCYIFIRTTVVPRGGCGVREVSKFPWTVLWALFLSHALYLHGRVPPEVEDAFAVLSLKCHH